MIFSILFATAQLYLSLRNRNTILNVVKVRFVSALATVTACLWAFVFGLGVQQVVREGEGKLSAGFGLIFGAACIASISDILDRFLFNKQK